jgi:hypothetical protein
MKSYRGVSGTALFILSWVKVGVERTPSILSRFTSGERAALTLSVGAWVGPRAGLKLLTKRKNLLLLP